MKEHENYEEKLKSMKNYYLYKDMVEKYPEIKDSLEQISKFDEDFFEQLDEYLPFIAEEDTEKSLKRFLEFLMKYEATEEGYYKIDELYKGGYTIFTITIRNLNDFGKKYSKVMIEIVEIMDDHIFFDVPDYKYRGKYIDWIKLRELIEEVYYSDDPEQTWDNYFKK